VGTSASSPTFGGKDDEAMANPRFFPLTGDREAARPLMEQTFLVEKPKLSTVYVQTGADSHNSGKSPKDPLPTIKVHKINFFF
jgi:hypothetical protein